MWKIKTKVNFDFSKAFKQLDKTIENIFDKIGAKAVKSMRKAIDNREYGINTSLSRTRKQMRDNKIGFPDGVTVSKNIPGYTPLKQTGRLYNSMQVEKKGIRMMDYGLVHNDGKKDKSYPNLKSMPKRPFIDTGIENINLDKLADEVTEQISKSIESKWKMSK
tara:strand:+ start:867 stop:1355 length:489 start_codon:yes stop_codon:yes gene_type:complete